MLIHGNYLSQKDIEICLAFDVGSLSGELHHDNMRELHEVLRTKYGLDDANVAAISAALPPSRDNAKTENHVTPRGIVMLGSEAASVVMPPPNR